MISIYIFIFTKWSVSGVHEESIVTVRGIEPDRLKALKDPLSYSRMISDN